MKEKFSLKRTVQCSKCPWKKSTNPYDIPDGYSKAKHEKLENTIAKDGEINLGDLNVMACHHSKDTKENAEHCVGWLHNQLGKGNNIGLRISMISCDNIKDLKIIGDQHDRFLDTLPEYT